MNQASMSLQILIETASPSLASTSEWRKRTTATVYAIDRVEHPAAPPSEIAARGRSQGKIPVVPFDLPEASAEELIRHAFSRISVRLVIQPLRDHALLVTEPNSIQDIEA